MRVRSLLSWNYFLAVITVLAGVTACEPSDDDEPAAAGGTGGSAGRAGGTAGQTVGGSGGSGGTVAVGGSSGSAGTAGAGGSGGAVGGAGGTGGTAGASGSAGSAGVGGAAGASGSGGSGGSGAGGSGGASGSGGAAGTGGSGGTGGAGGASGSGGTAGSGGAGPAWGQLDAYIKASNAQANDNFGRAVTMSTSGNVIAVSAWSEDGGAQTVNGDESDNTKGFAGAAYIMERTSSWAQTTYVKASNSDASDYFGWSIALSGDGNTLAVGAPKEDGNGTTESNNSSSSAGAVYVFVRAGNTWVQQAYLKAGVVDNGDNFGESVALSENGDVLAVGAQLEDGSSKGLGGDPNDDMAQGSGAAYVFNRSGTTWGAPVYIKGSNTEAGDQFGIRVALSGDGGTLAVTAGLEDSAAQSVGGDQNDNTATSAGAVYVFTGSGSSWSQQAYIKGSAQAREHYFGFATDLDADGNTLVVGAHGGDAAYVFRRTTNTWSEQALLRAVNYPQATGDFGDAVAISSDGNTVAVTIAHERGTASGVDGDYTMLGSSQSGATYLLNYSGGGWQPLSYIKATNPSVGNLFGFAVDLSGDAKTVLVGDTSEKSIATGINGDQLTIGATSSGAAYVYRAF